VAIRADAWRRARAGLQEFGLSPSSRTKVESDAAPPVPGRLTAFQGQRQRDPGRFFTSKGDD